MSQLYASDAPGFLEPTTNSCDLDNIMSITSSSASAYPPPVQFAQPTTSSNPRSNSSSSSERLKRRRTDSSPSVATTHDFPPAVRSRLRGRYPNECWNCEATKTDICHVVEKRDSWVSISVYADACANRLSLTSCWKLG